MPYLEYSRPVDDEPGDNSSYITKGELFALESVLNYIHSDPQEKEWRFKCL